MPWRENNLPVTNSKLTTLYIRVKTKKLGVSASWRENKKNFCLVGFDRLSLTMVELRYKNLLNPFNPREKKICVRSRSLQDDKNEGKIVDVDCKLNTPPYGHPSRRGEINPRQSLTIIQTFL